MAPRSLPCYSDAWVRHNEVRSPVSSIFSNNYMLNFSVCSPVKVLCSILSISTSWITVVSIIAIGAITWANKNDLLYFFTKVGNYYCTNPSYCYTRAIYWYSVAWHTDIYEVHPVDCVLLCGSFGKRKHSQARPNHIHVQPHEPVCWRRSHSCHLSPRGGISCCGEELPQARDRRLCAGLRMHSRYPSPGPRHKRGWRSAVWWTFLNW